MRLIPGPLLVIAISLVHPMAASGLPTTQADGQRTVWDGVYTEEQAERGGVQYTESCAGCHAPDLRGSTTSPSLVGMSFTFLWGERTLGELFGEIQQLMPTDRPNSLPAQTYPPGDLGLEADVLDQIIISAKPEPRP